MQQILDESQPVASVDVLCSSWELTLRPLAGHLTSASNVTGV
jgi:hypothetical protein